MLKGYQRTKQPRKIFAAVLFTTTWDGLVLSVNFPCDDSHRFARVPDQNCILGDGSPNHPGDDLEIEDVDKSASSILSKVLYLCKIFSKLIFLY